MRSKTKKKNRKTKRGTDVGATKYGVRACKVRLHPLPATADAVARIARAWWPSVFGLQWSAAAAVTKARTDGRQFTRYRGSPVDSRVVPSSRSVAVNSSIVSARFCSGIFCPSKSPFVSVNYHLRLSFVRFGVHFYWFYFWRTNNCVVRVPMIVLPPLPVTTTTNNRPTWTTTRRPALAPPNLSPAGGRDLPTSWCIRAESKDGWTYTVSFVTYSEFYCIIILGTDPKFRVLSERGFVAYVHTGEEVN